MSKTKRVKARDSRTGDIVEGTVIDIIDAKEPFSRVQLANGTEISIRLAVSQVIRLDISDEEGNPQYNITSQMMVNIHHADGTEESNHNV